MKCQKCQGEHQIYTEALCPHCGNNPLPEAAASQQGAVSSSALLEELEAALTLLCSAREKLKQEEDSSDYHRLCGQIERLTALASRRGHSSNVRAIATTDGESAAQLLARVKEMLAL